MIKKKTEEIFHPGDRVEIPSITGTVQRIDKEGGVWVKLDDTNENWTCRPDSLRKID